MDAETTTLTKREAMLRDRLKGDILNVALAGAVGRPGDTALATRYLLETVDEIIAERERHLLSDRAASPEGG